MKNYSIGAPHGGFKAGKVRQLAIYVFLFQQVTTSHQPRVAEQRPETQQQGRHLTGSSGCFRAGRCASAGVLSTICRGVRIFRFCTSENPPRSPFFKGGSSSHHARHNIGHSPLKKERVERRFRAACRSPAKRWPDAAGHAACKVGGISRSWQRDMGCALMPLQRRGENS